MASSHLLRGRFPALLAIVPALLGLALYGLDADLIDAFLPTRALALGGLLLTAGLLAIRSLLHHARGRASSRSGFVVVGLCVVMAAGVYLREYAAYREVEMTFESGGTKMAGTLYLPDGPGPHPALVIAQGSIRAPRRLYHFWADHLVRYGFAVYSFDKRGTGASGGVYEAENNSSVENLTLLARDVAAAAEAVRARPEIDPDHLGVFGLSQGGWLAPLATRHTDALRFMVVVTGTPVSYGEERFYSDLTGEGHTSGSGLDLAAIDSLLMAREPFGFDPRPILATSDLPALWLFGGSDMSVPVAKSVAVLDTLAQQGRPFQYAVFPEAGHLGLVMAWPFDLAPGFWGTMTDWFRQHAPDDAVAAR